MMNKIVIAKREVEETDPSVFSLTYENANRMLSILRSDHFRLITLQDLELVEIKNLTFLIQIGRLLKSDGEVLLKGGETKQLGALLSKLSLHQGNQNEKGKLYTKSRPESKMFVIKTKQLPIGFKSNETEEEIDESELLKGENIEINKKKVESCSTKVRACANCSCGRKQTEQNLTKEQLVNSINNGTPVAGCGKCSMGDSFRCGTCPYKGMPAFKPGDKLKLIEEGGVVVQEAATKVSATGKVKLAL